MNKNFIFIKNNNQTILYYLSFIPLIIYGLYKNGYLLVTNKYLSSFDAYKIILYPLVCTLIGIIFSLVFKKRQKEVITYALLMGVAAPYNFNMYLYFLLVFSFMFVVSFVPNKYKVNEVAFLITIFIALNYFSKSYSIFNPMEITNKYSYTLVDLFFGRGASYLFTSSIFYMIFSYFILSFIKTYKRSIPVIASSVFIILVITYMLITKTYLNNIKLLLNGTTIFSFTYLATINESSPSTKYIMYIYAALIGILSFITIYLFDIYTGSIISVFIISVIYRIYEIIRQNKFLKNA